MNNENNTQGSNVNGTVSPTNNGIVNGNNSQVVQPQTGQVVANQVPQQPTQPAPQVTQQQPVQQPIVQAVQPQATVPASPSSVQPQQPVIQSTQAAPQTVQVAQPQAAQQVQPQVMQTVAAPTQQMVQTQTPQVDNSVQSSIINNDLPDSKVSFISEGEKLKKKMNPTLKGLITSAIVAITVLLGYFVIYPFVVKTFFHNPKKIFDSAIDNVTQSINKSVIDWYGSQSIVSSSFKIDSNYESLKDFSGYTYGLKFGYDSNNKDMELGYSVINSSNKQEYSMNNYIKNKSLYSRYSNYRDLIYVGDINSDLDKIYSIFKDNSNSINEVTASDVNYIINKISSDIKDSIKKERLMKQETTINVNGKKVKVIKSSYTMNKNDIVSLRDSITSDLSQDAKVIDILAKATGQNKDEVKDMLNNQELMIEDDYSITFSIFTYGNGVTFAGMEISDSKDILIKYYIYNDEIDASINNVFDETVTINAVKKDKKTNVNVKYGEKNILTMVISTWEDNKKVFDYIFDYNDQKLTGSIDYEFKQNSGINMINIDAKTKIGEYYANVGIEFTFDKKSIVANVNVGSSKTLNSYEMDNIDDQFNELINNTPVKLLFQTSSGFNDPSINNSVYKLFYQWLTNEQEEEHYYSIDVPDEYNEDEYNYADENEDMDIIE